MKNTPIITDLARHLRNASESIEALTSSIASNEFDGNTDFVSLYADMRLDELEHAQQFMLLLTDAIVQDTPEASAAEKTDEGEGSVFAEGDLSVEKGDEETEETSEGE